ncbi:hypothetical protein THRCLA_00195, partial [Thraustotheca clavata]
MEIDMAGLVLDEEDPLDVYMRSIMNELGSATERNAGLSSRDFQRRPVEEALTRKKNRRYWKLQELYKSDYFSDSNMEKRCPSLYYLHLGKYIPQDTTTRAGPESLSSFLMAAMDKQALEKRKQKEETTWGYNRNTQRNKQETNDDFEEEFDSDSDDEDVTMESNDNVTEEELTIDERRQYLIDIMSQRFLQGLDGDFVKYDEIDANESFDDMRVIRQD